MSTVQPLQPLPPNIAQPYLPPDTAQPYLPPDTAQPYLPPHTAQPYLPPNTAHAGYINNYTRIYNRPGKAGPPKIFSQT